MSARAGRWVSVLAVASLGACGGEVEPTSAILVQIQADAALLASADTLRVRIYDTNRLLVRDEQVAVGDLALPAKVPIFPSTELPRSFHLEAELTSAGVTVAVQRLIGGFKSDEAIVVPIAFDAACGTMCRGHETCIGGTCQPACYDESALVTESRPSPRVCPDIAYVDFENGTDDDDRDCFSPAAPCATAAQAQTFLTDGRGGEVLLRGSMAHRPFRVGVSGAPGSPLVFRPWPGTGTPIVDAALDSGWSDGAIFTCCSETSAHHFVLEDLEVQNGLASGVYLHGTNCTDVVVRRMNIHSTRGPDSTATNYRASSAGIVATNMPSNIVIEQNWVHDNQGVGPVRDVTELVGVGGIGTANTPGPISITDNLVEDNAGFGIVAHGSMIVARNVIRRNGADGLETATIGLPIENNLLCSNGGSGIFVESNDDLQIRHNTILGSTGPGLLSTSWASNNVVEDNVFAFGNDVGLGWISALSSDGMTMEPAGSSEPLDDYNFIFGNAAGDYREIVEPGVNNRLEDPGLTGVAECNVQLSATSPLRGAARDGLDVGADLAALQAVLALATE